MTDNKKSIFAEADWALLFFLVGITYVKIYVKVAAIAFYFIYLLYKKYKTPALNGFSKFYYIMPVIGTIGSLLHNSFAAPGYWFGWGMSFINWIIAGIAVHFLSAAVFNLPKEKVVASIKLFFLVNALYSFGELVYMIIDSGQLVPYWYWEPTEYYGGSTGDHVKGIMSNISVTNATLNALGTLYFIYNNQFKWAALCIVILLLCTSNLTLILLLASLIGIFIFIGKKNIRMQILRSLLIIAIIYPVLSLNNIKYVQAVYDRETEKKETPTTIAAAPKKADLPYYEQKLTQKQQYEFDKSKYYHMRRSDSSLISYKDDLKYIQQFGIAKSKNNPTLKLEPSFLKTSIEKWYGIKYEKTPLALDGGSLIKIYTHKQTLYYLFERKRNLPFGAGMGNFSSKQAIKSTGLGMQGDYPTKYIYISDDFLLYHLYSLAYVFSLPIGEHSIINMPNSIYNQVAGEYGLIGILCFLLFYIGYILKHFKSLKATRYITPIFLLFLGLDYWFEMLTITAIFELFVLMDIHYEQDEHIAQSNP